MSYENSKTRQPEQKEVAPAVQANTPRPERGAGLSAVSNPSVTPGSEVHMRGGLHKEPATGGTISIVAVIG